MLNKIKACIKTIAKWDNFRKVLFVLELISGPAILCVGLPMIPESADGTMKITLSLIVVVLAGLAGWLLAIAAAMREMRSVR